MFRCSFCIFQSRHFLSLFNHYQYKHSHEPGFKIKCLHSACGKSFKNVKCCQRHIRVFHSQLYSRLLSPQLHNHVENEDIVAPEHVSDSCNASFYLEEETEEISYTKYLAETLLSTREKSKIGNKSLFTVCEDIVSVSSKTHFNTIRKVKKVLQDNNVDIDSIPQLKDLLNEKSPLLAGWEEINTDKKLDKYVYEHLCPVKPIEIVLGEHENIQECYQYVPILETLKYLLQFKDIQSDVLHAHKSEDHVLRDVCDGSAFQNNPLFSTDCTALQLILYLDEVNFVNPLGNKVKIHKIYAFYMQLGNLLPCRRSSLESVVLVSLCKSKLLKKYGVGNVLQFFINDIKTLENEGISVNINGVSVTFKGSILICVADNLAAHTIGGFMESFSALKLCRFCMISKSQLSEILVGIKRTKASYNEQCLLVQQNAELSKVYGIKNPSCLNELQYFHAVDGLPPDITHDIFEGVGKYVLSDIINYCISTNYFTLQNLNDAIESFVYIGSDKVNKPCILSSPREIKQTAAQTWCLLRLLPLIIGLYVPQNDTKWDILLKLLDVIEFICMHDIEYGQVLFIDDLIEDFSDSYKVAFPDQGVKPKFHFLHHYSEMTLKYGPLVHSWSIRFEAKHNWFKQALKSSKCFKNIEKTLAKRHQYMLSAYASKETFFNKSLHEISGGKVLKLSIFSEEVQDVIKLKVGNIAEIFQAKQIRVHNTVISSNCAIPFSEDGDLITFKEVKYCFLVKDEPYCLCQTLVTQTFARHYHAFKVKRGIDICMVKLSDLISIGNFAGLGIYNLTNDKEHRYISLKTRMLMQGGLLCQIDILLNSTDRQRLHQSSSLPPNHKIMKFHVSYLKHKRLLHVSDIEEKTFYGALVSLFPDIELQKVLVQWYITEIEDWVDVDDSTIEEWATYEKNMVIKIRVLQNEEVTNLTVVKHSSEPGIVHAHSMQALSCETTSAQDCGASASVINNFRVSDAPASWPMLPKYAISNGVLQILDKKMPLNRTHEMRICEGFYVDAVKYGHYYPTSAQYDKMAECVVTSYPHIKGQNTFEDAKIYWKEKLKYKFQNSRRRQDKDLEVCMSRKRKHAKCNTSSSSCHTVLNEQDNDVSDLDVSNEEYKAEFELQSLFPVLLEETDGCSSAAKGERKCKKEEYNYGLQCFLPPRRESETDESISSHIKVMKMEVKKRDANKKKINTLMNLTFPDRRAFIVNKVPDVSEVLAEYPVLTETNELLKEFLRLKPTTDMCGGPSGIEQHLLLALKKYSKAIIGLVSKKSLPPLLKVLQQALGTVLEKSEREYITACFTLLSIPVLMGENYKYLVKEERPESANESKVCFISYTGTISSCKKYHINLDVHDHTYNAGNLLEALAVLTAGIYVFNIQYPRDICSTWIFIQKFLLGLSDGTKTPKKVVKLLSQLK